MSMTNNEERKKSNQFKILYTDDDKEILNIDNFWLNKYNLIYGNNGSGKTSLSRFFADIKHYDTEEFKKYSEFCYNDISTDSKDNDLKIEKKVTGQDAITAIRTEYCSEKVEIAVFNQDFIDDNVFIEKKTRGKAIITIGSEQHDLLTQKAVLEKKIKDIESQSYCKNDYKELGKKIKDVQEFLSTKAKVVKDELYNGNDSFKKPEFIKKLLQNQSQSIINDNTDYNEKRESFKKSLDNPEKFQKIEAITELEILGNEVLELINKTLTENVVGDTLVELKNNPRLLQWFVEGFAMHDNHENDNIDCKYCHNPIKEDRNKAIKDHFKSNISSLQEECKEQINQINLHLKNVNEWLSYLGIELGKENRLENTFKQKLDKTSAYEAVDKELLNWAVKYHEYTANIITCLETKRINPYKNDFSSIVEFALKITDIVNGINKIINDHNKTVAELTSFQDSLIKYRVFSFIDENKQSIRDEIEHKVRELGDYLCNIDLAHDIKVDCIENFCISNGKDKGDEIISKIKLKTNEDIDGKKKEIKTIDDKIKNYQNALDGINEKIKKLGGKFELKIENDHYVLKRTNNDLSSLSEGEKTILALAYFFVSLGSQDYKHTYPSGTIIEKRLLLVIDDPISSLDDSNLYMICSFIISYLKKSDGKIEKFIILSHRFIVGKIFCKYFKSYQNFQLFAMNNGKVKREHHESFFDNEYTNLFQQVIKWQKEESEITENNKYIIGNVCRKVIEAFAHFKIKAGFEALEKHFTSEIDPILQNHISRSGNIVSHLRFDHFENLNIDVAKQLPKVVCDIIKSCDESHYNAYNKNET
jgi:wobble nucleotide-excising tRNase